MKHLLLCFLFILLGRSTTVFSQDEAIWEKIEEWHSAHPEDYLSYKMRLASTLTRESQDAVRNTFHSFLSKYVRICAGDEFGNIYVSGQSDGPYTKPLKDKTYRLYRFYYDRKKAQWFHMTGGVNEVFFRPQDEKSFALWFKEADVRIDKASQIEEGLKATKGCSKRNSFGAGNNEQSKQSEIPSNKKTYFIWSFVLGGVLVFLLPVLLCFRLRKYKQ